MSDDRPGGHMASTERGEILAFVAFISLLGTALAIVLIAKNGWSTEQWAAVAALAASVQAIVLIVGLGYASRQLSALREVEDQRRRRELVDRLEVAVYDVLPSLNIFSSTLRRLIRVEELIADSALYDEPARRAGYLEWATTERTSALDALLSTQETAMAGTRHVRRRLVPLGRGGMVLPYKIEIELIRHARWRFDFPDADAVPTNDEPEQSATLMDDLARSLEAELTEFLSSVEPGRPVGR